MPKKILTQSKLKELLRYCPDTGVFTWLISGSGRRKNRIAGSLNTYGYLVISVDCSRHLAHRLAFLYMTGAFPPEETDHINGIRNDNRWENLRCVNSKDNNKNRKLHSTNTSGAVGVYWHNPSNKWQASICVSGKNESLGYHQEFDSAVAARKAAEKQYGFHQNHGRS